MESGVQARPAIRAGDLDGLRRIYSDVGGLVTESEEEIMKVATGWEVNVRSPWRRFLPKSIFEGFGGKASSKLFVTNRRIVLVRDIDPWNRSGQGGPPQAAKVPWCETVLRDSPGGLSSREKEEFRFTSILDGSPSGESRWATVRDYTLEDRWPRSGDSRAYRVAVRPLIFLSLDSRCDSRFAFGQSWFD